MPDKVKIDCPSCHTKYNISTDKLPKQGKVKLTCKKCGTSFGFSPSEAEKKEPDNKISTPEKASNKDSMDQTMIGQAFAEEEDVSTDSFLKECEVSLTYEAEGREEKRVLDSRMTIIGRTEGDIIVDDPLISRKHASIEIKSQSMIELKDLASTNGTFHNGMKITSVLLQSGDDIKIGSTTLHFNSQVQFM